MRPYRYYEPTGCDLLFTESTDESLKRVLQLPLSDRDRELGIVRLPVLDLKRGPMLQPPVYTGPGMDWDSLIPPKFTWIWQKTVPFALPLDLGESLRRPASSIVIKALLSSVPTSCFLPPSPQSNAWPLPTALLAPAQSSPLSMPALPTLPQSAAPPLPAALPTPPQAATLSLPVLLQTPTTPQRAAPASPDKKRKRAITEDELAYHLALPRAKKGPDDKRACTVKGCGRRIAARQLKRHLESHFPNVSEWVCPRCCRSFSRRDSLARHRKGKHH